ncbi:leucine-rich repeat domain-containing protein [Treponema sp. OMZ 787]|uniref:leucine-rich repeat domain-containing protein n=1 Tax=Treponema sp. OMZ 787 TaxID=2563669 RepID=UPI0020A41F20|nr:leucine-rich repeat domain-containing protein [Treponema sp. OMZ 787]UTC62763.1 leucine-rich repeat domain-containing protein [Treponema sp. OMZ 787]
MKTNYVKTGLYSRYINLGFFVLMAALLLSSLVTGCKQNVIKKKIPYPDPQPYPNAADYKVEHWKQNIEGSGYTLYERETLEGKVGENTKAQAKNYAGFMNLPIVQKKITDDNSAVVKIKYNRKEITLTLNLNGGSTTTDLEDNKLKGRFGAPVPVVNTPTKTGTLFGNWDPDIPSTFPAESTTYTVVWTDSSYRIIIKGDERTNIQQGTFIDIPLAENKTWSNIKEQAKAKVTLKSEWNNGDYEVYEWRFNNENGELLTETEQMNKPLTVYAVTNYNKFNIEDSVLGKSIGLTADGKGYTGSEPKGKIIIPNGITWITSNADNWGAFKDCTKIISVRFPVSLTHGIGPNIFYGCTGLTSIDLSRCRNLTTISWNVFDGCTGLTSIDLSGCINLTGIGDYAFYDCRGLTSIDLSGCIKLTKIGGVVFGSCTALTSIDLSRCINLTEIGSSAFCDCTGLTSIDLSGCIKLTKIYGDAFHGCTGLTSIDLSRCINLTEIGGDAFYGCTNLEVKLPENIATIEKKAFGSPESFCKKVLIKSGDNYDRIKQLVIDSGYPEDRIGEY